MTWWPPSSGPVAPPIMWRAPNRASATGRRCKQAVDDEIRRRYSEAPGFEQWRDDGARLRALIDAGTIGVTSIIARRTTTPDRTPEKIKE